MNSLQSQLYLQLWHQLDSQLWQLGLQLKATRFKRNIP